MDAVVARPSEETAPDVARLGTRFLVFPQPPFIPGYERPELVWVSNPPGQITAGPADQRMYVVDPLFPKAPYEFPYLAPFVGDVHPPAEPGPEGHFDYLSVDSRQFLSAHVYACVRRMLDISQSYLGRPIPWFFEPIYDRLEIVPHLDWDNAHSGYGYLEMGEDYARGEPFPFALNFDAIAHEIGHLILLGAVGTPSSNTPVEFFGYHEAAADFLSLLGLLNFDTAVDRILRRTKGNLLIMNELDRFAELSDEKQVRMFNHALKMQDVSTEVHDLSKPFAGALFDTLIEVFQVLQVERGLSDLDPRDFRDLRSELTQSEVEDELSVSHEAYEIRHFAVKSVLIEARDLIGEIFARSWHLLTPDTLTFREAADALVYTAEAGRGERFADRVYDCFAWRGIL
jgi:hypothetical protein